MPITRTDVEQAFRHLTAHGISPNIGSKKWDIIDPDTGQDWPPKAVLRAAHEIAGIPTPNVGGGWPTNDRLKVLGFDIRLKPHLEESSEAADVEAINQAPNLSETEKKRLVNARLGQGGFRQALEEIWENCCALTGCDIRAALRASHIKPWRSSSNEERLDPDNGLLLVANADALFDRGLISFADDGLIIIASNVDVTMLGLPENGKIQMSHAVASFMEFHRENVFVG